MSKILIHRGPDDEGFFSKGPVNLAHRRLSIIDVSHESRQPMSNEDDTIWLVFNGEIYNYLAVRTYLEGKGHRFKTKSDSEVIIHAYEEWDLDCLTHLNGMWAFAIWDDTKDRLFCSRDRFGIKPFYFSVAENSFFFASEIKALLEHPEIGRAPDDNAVLTFLKYDGIDYCEKTLFRDVFQILPGHFILVNKQGVGKQTRYWDLSVNPIYHSRKVNDLVTARHFLELMEDSIQSHLQSDVPIGTCLSGGLDSSTVSMLIYESIKDTGNVQVGKRQKTFSACFDDPRFDESDYMKTIENTIPVEPFYLFPQAEDFLKTIPQLLYHNDEPFRSFAYYSQFCLMREASKKVKVVLDGQGADEILGGYLGYLACNIFGLMRRFEVVNSLKETTGVLHHHSGFAAGSIKQLMIRSKRRNNYSGESDIINRYNGGLADVLKREIQSTNLPYLLHWEDRTSMAFSIEARVPFLDHRLVEYVSSLPLDQKIRKGVTKYVLRKAMKGILPEKIRCRMDKKGFSNPEEEWMRTTLSQFMTEVLGSETFRHRKYWEPTKILDEYSHVINGSSEYSGDIWRTICTELWLQKFFDKREN